jgi:hypothetical protein
MLAIQSAFPSGLSRTERTIGGYQTRLRKTWLSVGLVPDGSDELREPRK